MKVAYHFACNNIPSYDRHFYKIILSKLLQLNYPFVSSKILIGDLLVMDFRKKIPNPEHLLKILIQEDVWRRINTKNAERLLKENVFIVCFETIQKELADQLQLSLTDEQDYLGAFEIDNSVEMQWWLYGECIGPKFRIVNKTFYVQIDNNEVEHIEYANDMVAYFKKYAFDEVKFEYSNYRYSIFDDNHNYGIGKKVAEWKKSIESLFSTIPDEIISKLIDTAPELSNKLWAITNTFSTANSSEQYAQVMSSCRRVFEYVTDCLFPATDEPMDGHSLKKDKYKNRLMAFAAREFKSNSNIDLIVTNTAALFEEWEGLYSLSNKGVHAEPNRQECRRCILRTILLLDDLIAIRSELFEVNVKGEKFISKIVDKFRD